MDQQSDTDNPQFGYEQEQKVGPDHRVRVQGVKIYTTAVRVIHWRCQKMIKVHDHGKYHNQPGLEPDFSKCQTGCNAWDYDMQSKMQQWEKHLTPLSPKAAWAGCLRLKGIFPYRIDGFFSRR